MESRLRAECRLRIKSSSTHFPWVTVVCARRPSPRKWPVPSRGPGRCGPRTARPSPPRLRPERPERSPVAAARLFCRSPSKRSRNTVRRGGPRLTARRHRAPPTRPTASRTDKSRRSLELPACLQRRRRPPGHAARCRGSRGLPCVSCRFVNVKLR